MALARRAQQQLAYVNSSGWHISHIKRCRSSLCVAGVLAASWYQLASSIA